MNEHGVEIREFHSGDEADVLALAPRLTEGVASWRDRDDVRQAVVAWVRESIDRSADGDRALFVAEQAGTVVGFVSVGEREHFAGEVDGYVGELVVATDEAGHGIGRLLMGRAEDWARKRGVKHLTLETGAANAQARAFYESLGFVEEDVRLTRRLGDWPLP